MVRRFPFGEQIAPQDTVVNNLKNLPGHIEFVLFPKLLGKVKAVTCSLFIKWGVKLLCDGIPAIKYELKQCFNRLVIQCYPFYLDNIVHFHLDLP